VSSPMPVYQVVLRLGCGGLEKMVVHLSRTLDAAKYRVTVCCLEDPGELAAELAGSHVSVVSLRKRGFEPGAFLRLAHRLRREQVRIVHTHNPAAHLYGAVAARMAGVPVVVHTRHGPRDDARHPPTLRARWLWNLTSVAAAVSQDTADSLLKCNPIDSDRVVSITNGIPVTPSRREDRAAVRSEFGIPDRAPTVGIVARLAPEKAHHTLLTAFTHLRQTAPEAHLLIVGDGPLRNALEQQAADQGTAQAVHFAGFRTDVHRMLAAMDVFVLCSAFEGTSLTLLEAMGARVPIVATAVGGNPEVIGGPENGWLVPPQDPSALAAAIAAVLSDPEAAQVVAERAHARMKSRYGVETMTRQYEALYECLLSRRPVAGYLASATS
jgi:glycosyltransferase involved in cell wall biosynthesis